MSLRQPVIIPSLTRIQAETILDSPESSDNSVITNIAGIIQREDATFLSFASPKREIKSKETPEGLSSLALNLYNSFNLPDIKVENVKRQSSEEVLRSEKKTIKSTQESFRKNYTKSEAVIQQDQAQKKCQLREAFFELIENIILSDDTEAFTDDNSKLWFPFDRSGTRSLADSVLIHLESLLSRLEYVEKVSEEENDSIIRLLRILNRALGEGTSKYFQEYVDESSIQYIDNSLKTCSVILLIFQNFPTIHGEELLLNIVGFISLLLDNLILPSMAGSDTVLKLDTSKILLRGIQQRITTLLEHVHTFLQHMEPGESAITRLEFMCSKLVFAESTNIILHPISIESMRVIAMKLLTGIFGRYKSQQQFILDEVLLSIEKLPLTRLKARQFKLKQGTNIQLTTALLLLLVESSAEVPIEKITENPSDRIGVMIASLETVTSHCNYIVNFLLEKASKSTKTGEDPHRLLLELFIEDFLNVLFLPEWSAAELIITCFIARFITILESEQSILNSQILALENLGLIIRRLLPIARHRSKVTNDMSTLSDSEFNEWVTSFNQVYYYLFSSGSEMDQLSGNYLLCSYSSVLSLLKKSNYFENIINRELGRNQSERNGDGRNENIAYFELLLYKPISRYYERVLRIILDSLDHSKVNLRSKALKLVSSLLDEDEEIFSVNSVQTSLSNGLIDSSPLVRDSAVEILGKYLIKHPQRDKELYLVLCERSNDTGIAVRKRVVKLFKEIFCTVQKDEVKIVIFDKLLRRMDDEEEIVGDLALQSLTELIFKIDTTTTNLEGQKLRRKDSIYLCNLLYQIYRKSEGQANLLKKFFSKVLNPLSKCFDKTKTEVAEQIVGVIRDVLTEELSTIESEKILCVLSLFATANGSLIDSSLVKFLEAFLIDDKRPISSLLGYYTLVTLRCHLETTVPTSKQRVQSLLLTQLTKFNLKELPEAVQCLWAVSKNSTKKIAVALLSCLKLLSPYEKQARAVGIKQLDQKFVRLIHLIGNLSRFCSLDDDWEIFQKHGVKSHDVSGLVIHKLIPFCSSLQSSSIKKLVLRNIGNICIGHPRHFLTEEVLKLLSNAIKSDNEVEIVLKIVLDHLNNEEFNANQLALFEERKESLDVGILHGITKKQESDGASSAIVQNILDSVLQISLQKEDSLALLATYLLEKILTQGYANPRVVS